MIYVCYSHELFTILDGYCSTVQGLLDWFEVDRGFTVLLFIQIDLCVTHMNYSHVVFAEGRQGVE